MGLIVLGIMALYVIIMLLNISYGFYFSISGDNRYTDGTMFLVRFYLGYAAILMVIIDLVLSTKYLKQFYLYLVIFFMILIGAGAALDMFFSDGNLIWAFFTAGMLQAYFFIIRSDTTVDKVTGIGNRSSFNEYINRIIRLPEKENYSLCMFDINGLKKINESLGVEEGDRALADLADILKKCSRQNDFIARIGGDEFIVIIRAKYIIEKLITRILKTIDARNEKKERPYTLSIAYGYDKFTTRSDQSIDEFLIHLKGLVFQHKNDQQREAGVRSV
jgi:diguanylate cyclase (GGDEF)-like protein